MDLREAAVPPEPGTDSGTLEGIVLLAGKELPGPTRVQNTTDPKTCGAEQSLEDLLVHPGNRGVLNVIVGLGNVPPGRIPPFQPGTVVLDNKDCRFSPHAFVLETGGVILATNQDPIHHTTHLYGSLAANISLPFAGVQVRTTVTRPGMIQVKCDIHGWMQAFVRVDDHPFHAVSDPDGHFRIPNIPPGSYRLEIWHEKLGSQERTVRVEKGKTEFVEISYSLPEK